MKLTCVGAGHARCLLLHLRHTHILLDCGLWAASHALAHLNHVAANHQQQATQPNHASLASEGTLQHEACPSTEQQQQQQQQQGPAAAASGQPAPVQPDILPVAYLGPFLKLLRLLEVEAVLLSTPESVLALVHLLARDPNQTLVQGPIYATVATLDAARHLAAELAAATAVTAAATAAATATAAGMASAAAAAVPATSAAAPVPAASAAARPAVAAADAGAGQQAVLGSAVSSGLSARHARARQHALQASGLSLPAGSEQLAEACWYNAPDLESVEHHLSRVKGVRYGQSVSLDGYELTATAFPTGAVMGAALWVISDGCRLIGYLPDWRPPAAPSCFLELDPGPISQLDALILPPGIMSHALSPASTVRASGPAPPQPPVPAPQQAQAAGFKRLHQAVLSAVSRGGSALIPLPATGVAWSVIDSVCGMLHAAELSGSVRVVYASPAARDSLALAQTSAEFMSRSLQASAGGLAEPTGLRFDRLQSEGRLVVASRCQDPAAREALQRPCVVVVPVASLTHGGDAWRLMDAWSAIPTCVCVLCSSMGCDPGVMATAIRAALPAMRMQLAVCDVGGPPHPSHLASLLSQLRPGVEKLIVDETECEQLRPCLQSAFQSLAAQGTTMASVSPAPPELHPYSWLDRLDLKLRPHVTHVEASPGLLQRLAWTPLGNADQHVAARLSGTLTVRHGKWHLDGPPPLASTPRSLAHTALTAATAAAAARAPPLLLGQPQVSDILAALAAQGLHDVHVHKQGQAPVQQQDEQPHQQQQQQQLAGVNGSMDVQGGPGGVEVTVIDVPQLKGKILLRQGSAEVQAPDPLSRKIIADCVTTRLRQL